MRETMLLDRGLIINFCAIPYIFVNTQRDTKTNKNIIAVYGSTNASFDNTKLGEFSLLNCIKLKEFSAAKCAWYWIDTYIYEEKWRPDL